MNPLIFCSFPGLLWPAKPIKDTIHLLLSLAHLLNSKKELLVLHFQNFQDIRVRRARVITGNLRDLGVIVPHRLNRAERLPIEKGQRSPHSLSHAFQ